MKSRLLWMIGCLALLFPLPGETGVPRVIVHEDFGTLDKVYQVGNLYFAGQPDKTTLQYFKNRGGVTVINLRDPSEQALDERALVKSLGLRYYNFPVPRNRPVNPSIMLAVSWAIEREGAVPILVHCSSGNRAALALAAHGTRLLGWSREDALRLAEQAGMTRPGARKKLEALLEEGLEP